MRWLFIVRFKTPKNGSHGGNDTKTYKTVAKDTKTAGRKMRKKGRIISIRKVKKVLP